ncbi:hypothetical protein ABZZ79_28540 [Streptomyces sp. NPDC006458]|uniref:hypothetical protein n=1 Tax=Streptomyces sp. NPDC006458 TaxID=3154302 RepID=UPI00339DE1B3
MSDFAPATTLTRGATGDAPIYDDLVREYGDVVAEARWAADRLEYEAAGLLGGQYVPRQLRLR